MPKTEESELVRTAVAIEEGMQALEGLASSLKKTRLHTEKAIQRAARELEDGMQHQERLASALRDFAGVIGRLQERQQKMTEALGEQANNLKQRSERMAAQMQRYAELGAKAAELTEILGAAQGQEQEVLASADEKLGPVIEEARSIARGAEDEDFLDIAREAKALEQRLQSIRTRIRTLKPS